MDAALKLFAIKGFDGTSVSGIAKEAGVAKGLIYNYFSSKEDIVHQLVMQGSSDMDGIIAGIMAQPRPQDKLRYVLNTTYTQLVERYDYYKLLTMLALKVDTFPEMKAFVVAKYNSTIPFIASIMEEMGMEDPMGEARILAALTDGFASQYMVLKDDYPLRLTIDDIIRKYCE